MTQAPTFPEAATSIAGFALAHAVWNVSDLSDDDLLCPLALIQNAEGVRSLLRFETDTQEQAIASGKSALRSSNVDHVAWAFAREGQRRIADSNDSEDILSIDFWARGMHGAATLVQAFERYTKHGRFHLSGELC